MNRRVGAALSALLVVLAYSRVFGAGWIWDDDDYVTENPVLTGTLEGLLAVWVEPGALPQYYPLVHSVFWLEHALFGLDPRVFHAVNLLVHLVAAYLVWRVLRALRVPGAALGALLFAVHPVQVETVAWVTELKNTLSLLCFAGALLLYVRARPQAFFDDATPPPRARLLYLAAFSVFVAALFSKTTACSLPAVILVLAWWRRGRIARAEVIATVPFFVIGVALAAVTVLYERELVGARGPEFEWSFGHRVLVAGRVVAFYLRQLLFPSELMFVYPRWEVDAGVAWQWLFPVVVVGAIGAAFALRERVGRSPLAALLLFVGTLFPALGLIPVYPMRYSYVADHFVYLPSVFALAALAAWLSRNYESLLGVRARPLWAIGLSALVAVGLAVRTHAHTADFVSAEALWRSTVAKNPDAFLATSQLAGVHMERGEYEEAERLFKQALATNPTTARTVVSYGRLLRKQGRAPESTALLEQTLARVPEADTGGRNLLRLDLARSYFSAGRVEDGTRQLRELWPDAAKWPALRQVASAVCGRFPERVRCDDDGPHLR
jgi:tetratricopeptide (TPR) repeat protein